MLVDYPSPLAAQIPDKSGFPSAERGNGAVRSGFPSGVRGVLGIGWLIHCAPTGALTATTTDIAARVGTRKRNLISLLPK